MSCDIIGGAVYKEITDELDLGVIVQIFVLPDDSRKRHFGLNGFLLQFEIAG